MFNMLKTAVLMAAITALFMAIGSALGGQQGMVLALLVALGMNFFSYWFSDKLVLKMYAAREVDASTAQRGEHDESREARDEREGEAQEGEAVVVAEPHRWPPKSAQRTTSPDRRRTSARASSS